MTLRLIEGFDHTQDISLKKWVTANGLGISGEDRTALVAGRLGGYALNCSVRTDLGIGAGNAKVSKYKMFSPSSTHVILGFAWNMSDNMFTDATATWEPSGVFLVDASSTIIAGLELNGTRNPIVETGTDATVATSSVVHIAGTWHYYELRMKINGASGECELRTDGGTDIATTVANFGTTPIAGVKVQVWGAGEHDIIRNNIVDDVYLLDVTSGTAPHNNFLGDCQVETIMPTGAGASTDWTTSGGPNWQQVDDSSPDGTTMVSTLTPGDVDTYQTQDLATMDGTVYAVQTNLVAKKLEAGSRTLASVIRQSGVDYAVGSYTPSTSWADYLNLMEQNPAGGAWSKSLVDANEFGIKLVS